MKNSGCHGAQSKKPLKIFSQITNWIALLFCRNVPLDRGLQNFFKKNDPSKNIGFMEDSFSFYYAIE